MSPEVEACLDKAREAISRKDELKRQIREIDAEILQISQEYGKLVRIWGWSEDLLRRAIYHLDVKRSRS